MRFILLSLLAAIAGCSRAPTAPEAGGALLSVAVVSAEVRAGSAHVVWQVRPTVAGTFMVQRRLDGAPWKGLAQVAVGEGGRLVLDDGSVQPGASYRFRVRLPDGMAPGVAGEVALQVPAR